MSLSAVNLATYVANTAVAQSTKRSTKGSPKKSITLGEVRIEGTIQKPQAFYILQRSSLNFQGLELKNSFVPKILQSIERAPF